MLEFIKISKYLTICIVIYLTCCFLIVMVPLLIICLIGINNYDINNILAMIINIGIIFSVIYCGLSIFIFSMCFTCVKDGLIELEDMI